MRNFKELEIWTLGMEIVKNTYELSSQLPVNEKFNLISQITRSAVSIPSNIAEGCAKSSEREFKLYLERALGSTFELETQLLIIKDTYPIEGNKFDEIMNSVQNEQRKLGSFISTVKKRIPNS